VRPHAVTSVSGTVQSDPVEPSGQTIYINPGTQQVPFYEVTTGSEASTRVYVSFGGKVVSQVRTTIASGVMQYHLMTDSQGSIISEGAYGTVTQDMAFDAWGKTRDPDAGSDYGLPPEGGWAWHNERLYTGHESHQDQYVINMNGRLYDPVLSRMLSADPFVPGAGNNPQGLNRYAYVFNNPLRYTDPDGFKPFWKKKWFRTVVAVAASIYAGHVAGQWMMGYADLAGSTAFAAASTPESVALLSGTGYAAAGAAGGFTGGLIASGGNLEAAFAGAVTGAAFGAAGSLGSTGEVVTGHAAAGCLSGVVQGGGCGRGAASAVVGKAVTLGIGGPSYSQDGPRKFVAATLAGGISSKVAGGHFGTGAQTAAFGYLFNQMMHEEERSPWRGVGPPPLVADANANIATHLTRAWNNFWDAIYDSVIFAKPPQDAYDPNGPKAPGKPGSETGFRDPRRGENWVPNPNGRGSGWEAHDGRVWVPTGPRPGNAHGGPHWDVQTPGRPREYENVYPDSGRRR
jgi:RHS repeat-associated protein